MNSTLDFFVMCHLIFTTVLFFVVACSSFFQSRALLFNEPLTPVAVCDGRAQTGVLRSAGGKRTTVCTHSEQTALPLQQVSQRIQ